MTVRLTGDPEPGPAEYGDPARIPARVHREPSTTRGDAAIRVATVASVIGVAGVAVYVSYRHAYELVLANGEDRTTAYLMPATVDGLIMAASMTMLDAARRNRRPPALARWTLGLGITASILANVTPR